MVTIRAGPVRVGGVTLRNHLILAAGVLGTTGSSLARVISSGAGGVVTKSIGPRESEGHKGPCVTPLPCGLLNAMGLPNPSRSFTAELERLQGEPVIVSIFGGSPEEFAEVASWFRGLAVGLELNLSCPHAEGFGAAIGSRPEMVEECTRAASRAGMPVWVKLTPNVTDIAALGRAAERGGADAVVAINTVKAMRISTDLRLPVLGNRFGGLSGPAVFPVAIRCIYELYEACRIPVIGCGGVSSAGDVVEMMMAGASAVEIGTAVMHNQCLFQSIADELYTETGEDPATLIGCVHG